VPDDKYDKKVLDSEIEQIRNLDNIKFSMNQKIGRDISLNELQNNFDAIIIATGTLPQEGNEFTEVTTSKRGITVNPKHLRPT